MISCGGGSSEMTQNFFPTHPSCQVSVAWRFQPVSLPGHPDTVYRQRGDRNVPKQTVFDPILILTSYFPLGLYFEALSEAGIVLDNIGGGL